MAEATSAAENTNPRILNFFAKAGLQPPRLVPPLAVPSAINFQSSLSLTSNNDAARSLLALQRVGDPGYKAPERQLRHRWSTTRLNEKSDQAKWTFTKHEVAKAFDGLISGETLPPPGVAQALLHHASATSLDELWCHLHDPKLEKRIASRFKRSRPSIALTTTWLGAVTTLENSQYVRLMCDAGLTQDVVDTAFGIAMSKRSMDVLEVLLGYSANASASKGNIRECFGRDDVALATLLLSTPKSMSIDDWRYCIERQAASSPKVLVLTLAHHPSVTTGPLLLEALKAENLAATAIMLAYASSDETFRLSKAEACRLATLINDNMNRHKVFAMLAEARWLTDSECLQQELMRDVKLHEFGLVRILRDAGVTLDVEPNNALAWAISRMDLDILELFEKGTLASPVSAALKLIPGSTSEEHLLKLFHIFRSREGLAGEPLNVHLVLATQKHHRQLVWKLITSGASVEFREALAIRTALLQQDFETLGVLLEAKCSSGILSNAMPIALALKSRPSRLRAMMALVSKGVLPQALGTSLLSVLSEDGEVDLALVQLLLKYLPSADSIGHDTEKCVLAAIRRGNLLVLGTLCNAWPRVETLSKAVPVAFETRDRCTYVVALGMIKLLLEKGAAPSLPVHDTLLAAVSHDHRLDVVRLLVGYGADANHRKGACFSIAIESRNLELLKVLCDKCPPSQSSLESVVFKAIDRRWYSPDALQLLLQSAPSAAAALNALMSSASAFAWFRNNPDTNSIISCFLQRGLDVNVGDGALLSFAIQEKDVALLKDMLSANPNKTTLRLAFSSAASILARDIRLTMMELLLWQSDSAEIGQSAALWQLTHTAIAGDLVGLKLLLRHGASVDFDNGSALQIASHAGSLEVLDLLMASRCSPFSIERAFLAAKTSSLTSKEKHSVYKHLLTPTCGLSTEYLSNVLAESVSTLPESTQLVSLLLARGAEPKLETLKFALGTCSHDMYTLLLSKTESTHTAVEVFKLVRSKTLMPLTQRYEIYKVLLAKKIPQDAISGALVDALNGPVMNLDLPKLLLEHGAAVSYDNAKGFRLALLAIHSVELFRLLVQHIEDDKTAGVAFDLARKHAFDDPDTRVEICRSLLQWNIAESSLSDALEDFLKLKGYHADTSAIQLLLRKGADPNKNNARCFILACANKAEAEFRALSRHANLAIVLQGLLSYFQVEGEVVHWFNMCLEERPRGAKIVNDQLLFQCLNKFPKGVTLLKLLLDNGVSAAAMKKHKVCAGNASEQCTALIWALVARPSIENDAILAMLSRGGRGGLSYFWL